MKKDKLVVEEIVKYMQQQIKDGAWAVNTKIPSENELCSRLGVGRGSVRAAIQRFNVLGILESTGGARLCAPLTFPCLARAIIWIPPC